MSHVFDHRPSPATIIALLALFVALGAMLASPELASAANGDNVTDTDPNGTASDYSAQINWGDGTTSDGTISPAMGGGFDVSGTQTYSSPGQKAVQVTVQDLGGSVGYSNSTATVAPARPIALISAPPATASIFALHQKVSMRFSCREGLGGPGLQSCVACPSTSRPSGAGCVSSRRTFAGAVRL